MALEIADRVKETTTTTSTGTYALAGAVDGFQSFAAVGDGNTTYYACTDGTDYEVGIGSYTASGTTLSRVTILESSNSDAAVSWGAGTKEIFVTVPAEKYLVRDASGNVSLTGNLTISGTVDGRDVAADGSKLDGIESGATADQTAAQIRAKVEAASDSNVFTDADHTKLNGIEANAKDDQIITAGSGLTGGGTGDVTLSHADTSSQASVNGSGRTYIQDITLDTYGHVTGLATATETVVNTDTVPNNATITISAGNALTGGGNFTTDQASNETITINHQDTSSQASVNNSGRTYIQDITLDSYGHVTGISSATETVVNTDTNTTSLPIENSAGTAQFTATDTTGLQFVGSGATSVAFDSTNKRVTISSTDTNTDTNTTYSAGSGLSLSGTTFSHTDTSSQGSVNNSGGTVIQDVTLDTYGHVTGLTSYNLDGRYYTETEADSRFVNVTGDTMTAPLTIDTNTGSMLRLSATNSSPWAIELDRDDATASKVYNGGGYWYFQHRPRAAGNIIYDQAYHPEADKWTTARTLSLSGDASGSVSWDGSANATLSVAISDDSHNHNHSDGNFDVNGLLTGGLGAASTSGTADWNHSTNARAGMGYTLLLGTHTNGPGSSNYFHPFSFEYSSKDGSGNLTQFAMPYTGTNGPYFRSRYSGTWSAWAEIWNSGNDGSGSGLDADKLDGLHESSFMRRSANSHLEMNNYNITEINHLQFNDPGPNEGIEWVGGNGWKIYESPNNLTTNSGGNLQFVTGTTRKATIDTSGNFEATGNVNTSSDARLKDNVTQITDALDKIGAIRGVTYNRNDIDGNPRQAGVIAQEVEAVLPEVVWTGDDGYKSVAYGNMVGLLIEAIKEQQTQIDALTAQVEELKRQ